MTNYRSDIDGLRGIAVAAVVIFHAFPHILPSGFIGVDVFFVISGYLISSLILEQMAERRFSTVDFYARRIRRIFPALILCMALTFALGWNLLAPPELASLGKHIAAGTVFLSNFLLNSEAGYFDVSAIEKPMLHLWSLSIEEQFYLCWPLILFVAARVRIPPVGLVLIGGVASFAYGISTIGSSPSAAFFLPLGRFWELMAGAFVAALEVSYKHRAAIHSVGGGIASLFFALQQRCSSYLSILGVLALSAGLCLIREGKGFPGWWALLPVLGTALLISAGARGVVNKMILSNRVLVGIGLISYPLYLFHWPLLSLAHFASLTGFEQEPSVLLKLMILAVSAVLSWLIFVCVERPMRRPRWGIIKALLLVIAMAWLGFLGWSTDRAKGFFQHQSPTAVSFYTHDFQQLVLWRAGLCFHEAAASGKDLDFDKCTATSPRPGAPRVLLWGDSLAAHLYPGFQKTFGDQITLTQMTLGRCPPVLGGGRFPECDALNNRILERIKSSPPDVIVMASEWPQGVMPHFAESLRTLKAAGVKKIIIVGNTVQWIRGATLLVARSIQSDPWHRVRRRYRTMMKPESSTSNQTLKQIAEEVGVLYVSPYDVFCNDEGCLAVNGDTPDKMVSMDQMHLGPEGARLLVEKLPVL